MRRAGDQTIAPGAWLGPGARIGPRCPLHPLSFLKMFEFDISTLRHDGSISALHRVVPIQRLLWSVRRRLQERRTHVCVSTLHFQVLKQCDYRQLQRFEVTTQVTKRDRYEWYWGPQKNVPRPERFRRKSQIPTTSLELSGRKCVKQRPALLDRHCTELVACLHTTKVKQKKFSVPRRPACLLLLLFTSSHWLLDVRSRSSCQISGWGEGRPVRPWVLVLH